MASASMVKRGPTAGPVLRDPALAGRRIMASSAVAPHPSSSLPTHSHEAIAAELSRLAAEKAAAAANAQAAALARPSPGFEPTVAALSAPDGRRQPLNGGRSLAAIHGAAQALEEAKKPKAEVAQDGESVADTLAWVRAKSEQRRQQRKGGLEGKENNYDDDSNYSGAHQQQHATPQPTNDVVAASLARGAHLLKSVESNMNYFETYLSEARAGAPPPSTVLDPPQQKALPARGKTPPTNSSKTAPAPPAPKSTNAFSHYLEVKQDIDQKHATQQQQRNSPPEKGRNPTTTTTTSSANLVYQKLRPVPLEEDPTNSRASYRLKQALDAAIPDVTSPRAGAWSSSDDAERGQQEQSRRASSSKGEGFRSRAGSSAGASTPGAPTPPAARRPSSKPESSSGKRGSPSGISAARPRSAHSASPSPSSASGSGDDDLPAYDKLDERTRQRLASSFGRTSLRMFRDENGFHTRIGGVPAFEDLSARDEFHQLDGPESAEDRAARKMKEEARRRAQFRLQEEVTKRAAKDLVVEHSIDQQKALEVDFKIMIREASEEKRRDQERLEAEKKAKALKLGQKEPPPKPKPQVNPLDLVPAFDPDKLEGVLRAKEAAEKRVEDKKAAEEAAAQARLFKARPLPGGVTVTNDLLASTKASEMKDVRNDSDLKAKGGKWAKNTQQHKGPVRMDAADLFKSFGGNDQQYDHHGHTGRYTGVLEEEDDDDAVMHREAAPAELLRKQEERERIRRDKKAMKEQEQILSLQEEIDRLEQRLKKGKYAGGAGVVDGAAVALTADDDSSCSSATTEEEEEDIDHYDGKNARDANKPLELEVKPLADGEVKPGPDSAVYRRQEKWLEERNKKRQLLKEEKEKKALEGFTGKPEVASAKESWEKTKKAHRLAAEKAKLEEQQRTIEKIQKEEAEEQRRLQETEQLKLQIRIKKQERTAHIDPDKQKEALEKLSVPRNSRNPAAEAGIRDETDLEAARAKERLAQQKQIDSIDEGGDDGFGDLDEKQYIKVMKALGLDPGITAIKKKKKIEEEKGGKGGSRKHHAESPSMQTSHHASPAPSAAYPHVDNKVKNAARASVDMSSSNAHERSSRNGPDSIMNAAQTQSVGRHEQAPHAAKIQHSKAQEPPHKVAPPQSKVKRDWQKADFVNDSSVMQEIDDVFAELESDKWGVSAASNTAPEAEEEDNFDANLDDSQFAYDENAPDDGDADMFNEEPAPPEDDDCVDEDGRYDRNELFQEDPDIEEYVEEEPVVAPTKKWNFSGHTNTEGIMAHASSALEAAEAALSGLMGGGDTKKGKGSKGGKKNKAEPGPTAEPTEADLKQLFDEAIEVQLEPYEKYERGQCSFFDRSSSVDKGRFRVRDARDFAPESMRRKEDTQSTQGVMLLLGKRKNVGADGAEQAITILFDKSFFTEERATKWWTANRHRFVGGGKYDSGGNYEDDA